MYQQLGQRINDIIVFVVILYITLIFFNVLKAPNDKWQLKVEKMRESKWRNVTKILLPLGLILLFILIFWE